MNQSLPLHRRFRSLRTALLRNRLEGRGELFHSRDKLRELGDSMSESAFASFQPLLLIALEVLGQVIRHDGLGREEALVTAESLVEFVESAVKQASSDRPETLRMAAAEATGAGPVVALGATGFHRRHPVPEVESLPRPRPQPQSQSRSQSQPPSVIEYSPPREVRLDVDAVDETRLGEILIKMQLVQPADMTRALSLQQVTRRRLGDILLAMRVIDEGRLRDALERQRYATLRMANRLALGGRSELELRIANPDLIDDAGRTTPRLPHAR